MTSQETKEKEILEQSKVIAVVGLSPDTEKPSNIVAQYLIAQGYRIIPVNPSHDSILGQKTYKTLSDIPENIDIVDIFMRADRLLPVVEEAARIKPKCIWLQLGIVNEEAKRLAEENGITFFMDRCIKIEHSKLVAHG
ncbi:MAG TPA: CoA-binding protein [Syntrophorhabdaceae bacterium]|nr:CoA-binding protein [Syntrophorhabdaceae bacterium]HQM81015.1 CoA-binding protein [Syntrophorhabdaceae bacterium]